MGRRDLRVKEPAEARRGSIFGGDIMNGVELHNASCSWILSKRSRAATGCTRPRSLPCANAYIHIYTPCI